MLIDSRSRFSFVPESPRWLMAEGRFEEALKILKDGAKTNKRTLPPDDELLAMMDRFRTQEEEEVKAADPGERTLKEKVYEVFKELIILVETPEIRKRTVNIFWSWLVVAMVYYGLSFNSKNLGGNRYVNTFASGFVEVNNYIVHMCMQQYLLDLHVANCRCQQWWPSFRC